MPKGEVAPFYLFVITSLMIVESTTTSAEPCSPSYKIVLEKFDTIRKILVPFLRTIEMLRANESAANRVAVACRSGERSSVEKPHTL